MEVGSHHSLLEATAALTTIFSDCSMMVLGVISYAELKSAVRFHVQQSPIGHWLIFQLEYTFSLWQQYILVIL
jgi:hypothetical protein